MTLSFRFSFGQGATPVLVLIGIGKQLLLLRINDGGPIVLMNGLKWKDGIPARITSDFLRPLDGDSNIGVTKDGLQVVKGGDKHVALPPATRQQEVPQEQPWLSS